MVPLPQNIGVMRILAIGKVLRKLAAPFIAKPDRR